MTVIKDRKKNYTKKKYKLSQRGCVYFKIIQNSFAQKKCNNFLIFNFYILSICKFIQNSFLIITNFIEKSSEQTKTYKNFL